MTITLPRKITRMIILASGYTESGKMTDCRQAVCIDDTELILQVTISGSKVKLFFLNASNYMALFPALIL